MYIQTGALVARLSRQSVRVSFLLHKIPRDKLTKSYRYFESVA